MSTGEALSMMHTRARSLLATSAHECLCAMHTTLAWLGRGTAKLARLGALFCLTVVATCEMHLPF
jgi:hypothetical protein